MVIKLENNQIKKAAVEILLVLEGMEYKDAQEVLELARTSLKHTKVISVDYVSWVEEEVKNYNQSLIRVRS
jgi:hypothetical protein